MSKRRIRDEDDSLLMPPPATSTSTGRVLYYPEDDGHPLSKCLAPTSSPPPRQPSMASTSRPVFGRYSSTGPKRRSALDNIGYVPEDIPTPRTTRPFSIAVTTGKRRKGLRVFAAAATLPVRPAKPAVQPAASPSKHSTPLRRSVEVDDDEYIVDSSEDEGPVRFNLPAEDAPRSSKIPRTTASNISTRPTSTRTGTTPSTSRLGPGTTPARRKDLAARLGITPARPVATPHSKSRTTQINTTPIRLDLSTKKSRPVFRPTLPASEASPFVSSPFRAFQTQPKPAEGPTRIAELKGTGPAPSPVAKRAFSSSGAKCVSSLAVATRPPLPTPAATGTKRAPGSKSTSPGAPGAKRPRIATPSPSAAEDVIVVSSSDDEEGPEERRPSPSPSLGEYRPTPTHSARSRAGSGSASSDIVLLEPPTAETAGRDAPRRESPREEAPARDPPREATPEPSPPPKEVSRRPSTPKDVPRPDSPLTPSPSRHSSSSSRAKASAKSVEIVESSDSLRPFRGRRIVPGRGRRKRLSQREPQSPEPESEPSPQEVESSPFRPADSSPSQPEPSPSEPTKSSPFRRPGSTETVPPKREESPPRTTRSPSPWTGKPLFRPSTTIASGLTPLRDSPDRSIRPTPGPSKSHNIEPTKSPEFDRTSLLGDDPLQSMYDSPSRPIFGPPQYLVMGPPRPPRAFPSASPGPSTIFSYSHLSIVSSVPPPTITPIPPAARRIRRRMDCVLLPRAPKAFRLALEREQRQKKTSSLTITIPSKNDKGKAKDPSEYPPRSSSSPSLGSKSQAQSSSSSSSSSPSTTGPAHQPPVVKYLVIDPQLALRSNYESLPPEIDESPDRYCHCCRTRSGVGKLKMRCVGMSYRRRRGVAGNGPHECGLYWCQRCIAKHDIPFNPTAENFKCPFCNGTCECDVCRRDRGQEPLGRWAIKVVTAKPGKRTLDAFVKGRVASGSKPSKTTAESSGPSNPAPEPEEPSDPVAELAGPSNPVAGPSTTTAPEPEPEPEGSSSTGLEPESPRTSAAAPAPSKITSAERGPTTWHGRHTPPPLRRRHASGGHALSTEAHIFIPRGPRGVDPVDELPEMPEAEPVLEEDEEPVEEEPVWGDRHRAFEGDYSAADASLLDAVSGAFEFGIEHGPGDLGTGGLGHETDGAGVVGHLGVQVDSVEAGPGEVGVESGAGDLVIGNTGDPVAGAEGEPPAAHTPPDDASRGSSEALGGTLAYPPTESSQGSQPDAPMDTVPVESATHTITGTLDGHAPAGVLEMPAASAPDDAPGEISHDILTRIFNESVQGFVESESEHDYGPPARSRHSSEIDELQSTPGIDEPRPPTPDLDEIRAALGLGDTGNQEPTSGLGQLHTEGTFETVPRISMGGGDGGLTIHGSLQDISLFNAVMDCSDETRDIALSSSQTEHAFTVCGSLLDETYSYPFDLEQLAIPELEDSESEREPDLVPTTDPESSKSTILETPSPQLEPDTDSNLARFRNLFDATNEPRATPFVIPTEAKQDHMRKILQSHFAQQAEPETRTTRSQTRKSKVERSKFLRSKRCYGVAS